MLPAKTITLYYDDSLKRLSEQEALQELKDQGRFQVFVSFINPKTNCLVDGLVTFHPKPQITPMGRCFMAECEGFLLRIPSDLGWWIKKQKQTGVKVIQKTAILVEGEFVNVEFDLEILPHIRIQGSPSS